MTGLVYGFSKIVDGNMATAWGEPDEVVANRRRFLAKHGIELNDSVLMNVERHGTDIYEARANDRGLGALDFTTAPLVDVLVTNQPDLPLLLLTADCYPLIFHDTANQAVGLAHAGWRGVDKKIVQKVIGRMHQQYGTDPKSLEIIIGPGIGAGSYVMEDAQQKNNPEWKGYITEDENGMKSIDLVSFIIDQALDSGVMSKSIIITGIDTVSDTEYFSHYRAVRSKEKEGRMLTFAYIVNN